VSADSDFSIYCLLSELEKWKEAHDDNFPEIWYIQIDGGSENANQYLLAALEYLVIKRMVGKIVVTRYDSSFFMHLNISNLCGVSKYTVSNTLKNTSIDFPLDIPMKISMHVLEQLHLGLTGQLYQLLSSTRKLFRMLLRERLIH
jgi:hypothetical protein